MRTYIIHKTCRKKENNYLGLRKHNIIGRFNYWCYTVLAQTRQYRDYYGGGSVFRGDSMVFDGSSGGSSFSDTG